MDDRDRVDRQPDRRAARDHLEGPGVARRGGDLVLVEPWQRVEADAGLIVEREPIPTAGRSGPPKIPCPDEQDVARVSGLVAIVGVDEWRSRFDE